MGFLSPFPIKFFQNLLKFCEQKASKCQFSMVARPQGKAQKSARPTRATWYNLFDIFVISKELNPSRHLMKYLARMFLPLISLAQFDTDSSRHPRLEISRQSHQAELNKRKTEEVIKGVEKKLNFFSWRIDRSFYLSIRSLLLSRYSIYTVHFALYFGNYENNQNAAKILSLENNTNCGQKSPKIGSWRS